MSLFFRLREALREVTLSGTMKSEIHDPLFGLLRQDSYESYVYNGKIEFLPGNKVSLAIEGNYEEGEKDIDEVIERARVNYSAPK